MSRRRYTTQERLAIFLRRLGHCARCGGRIRPGQRWDLDHVVPLALGGRDEPDNLQVVCAPCHRQKTRRDVSAVAKAKRIEARHWGAHRSPTPLPCGRASPWKRTLAGELTRRYAPPPAPEEDHHDENAHAAEPDHAAGAPDADQPASPGRPSGSE
ncbi:HNH endonuclease [Alsobacter sp. SYSU BS001988]